MSRGFVKEDDQEEAPFITPRAALPPGETNYVTPLGYNALVEERKRIEKSLAGLDIDDEKEKRHQRATLTGSLNLLNERIFSARIIKPEDQPKNNVRFGATVLFRFRTGRQEGQENSYQLVGVDESNIALHKIAFVAPLAKALTGKKIGETTEVFMGGKVETLEILNITY